MLPFWRAVGSCHHAGSAFLQGQGAGSSEVVAILHLVPVLPGSCHPVSLLAPISA